MQERDKAEIGSSAISRRQVLGGAATLGLVGLPETIGGMTGLGSGRPMARAAARLQMAPTYLPPVVPGARVDAVHFSEAFPVSDFAPPTVMFAGGGIYNVSSGWLDVPLPLEPGDSLLRLDLYFKSTSSPPSLTIELVRYLLDAAQAYTPITLSAGFAGGGMTTATYLPPGGSLEVLDGHTLFVEISSTTKDCTFVGAIVQSRPANPRIHLLDAPVRIYDSRPGNAPNNGPKSPLTGGVVRAGLDAKNNGSGVPSGARAIMANVTVVNTVASGFLLVYKNGITTPLASTLNWSGSGQIAANGTTIALDESGLFSAYVGPGARTDFIVDVLGYLA